MARDHARIHLSVWDDPEFVALTTPQQWTYFALCASRQLSYCGVHPLVPAHLAKRSRDMTERKVAAALSGLEVGRFVVIDEDTAEIAVRTYVYHDGILKMPNVVRAMNAAFARVMSVTLRAVIVDEVTRAIWRTFPDGPPDGIAKALREGFAEGFAEGPSHSLSPFPFPLSPSTSGSPKSKPLPTYREDRSVGAGSSSERLDLA